jgi:hypothetical protein
MYQTPASIDLARAGEILSDKFSIIGMNIINLKNYKTTSAH